MNGFDLQLRLLKQFSLFAGVEPEVRKILGNDTADFADFERDGSDFLQIVFSSVMEATFFRSFSAASFSTVSIT